MFPFLSVPTSKLLLPLLKLDVCLTFKKEGCGSRFMMREGTGKAF